MTNPSAMHALIYRSFGDPTVLEWVDDWPRPSLRPDQILVRPLAGSVNPKDVLLRKGKYGWTRYSDRLPRVSGHDICGEVIEVGQDASGFEPGDRVFGMTNRFCGGVHAEIAAFSPHELAPAPSALPATQAAAIPLAALTALQALRDVAGVKSGQRVLINGASGGVGHFAVQIARILGADVHAVCGPHHVDFVRSMGADEVTDYRSMAATSIEERFDLVFDVFGKLAHGDFRRQIGKGGIYISTVPKTATLIPELLARVGIGRNRLVIVQSRAEDLRCLCEWADEGRLKPHVDATYSAADATGAHRHVETRRTTGKVVIEFGLD